MKISYGPRLWPEEDTADDLPPIGSMPFDDRFEPYWDDDNYDYEEDEDCF